jgi:hypothetical protein
MNSFNWPPQPNGSGGSGVSSLNSLTGGLALVSTDSSVMITPSGSTINLQVATSSGTVTSVGMTTPGVLFTVSGSPITSSGVLALTLVSQAQNLAFLSPVSGSGTPSWRSINLLDLPSIASDTILGNNTGGTDTPSSLTATQVTAMLNVFTSSLQGLVPASGGGTTEYLRADGTFAVPPGSGSSYTFADSIQNSAGTVSLVGDTSTPGDSVYYGTNAAGTRGYYALPSSVNSAFTFWSANNTSISGGGAGSGSSSSTGERNVFIGDHAQQNYSSSTGSTDSVVIGYNASTGADGQFGGAVVIGSGASVSDNDAVSIGYEASGFGIAIGVISSTSDSEAIAIGNSATTTAANAIAIGYGVTVGTANRTQIGNSSTATTLIAGGVSLGLSSTTVTHSLNTSTGTNGAGVLTLTNAPTGRTGNPAGYITINVNGVLAYMPYWT